MNKSDFVAHIAKEHSITKQEAELIINRFTTSVTSALKSGNEISLVGFGNFTVSDVATRNGINPKTKEPLKIDAYKQPKFKTGKALKDAVNGR